MRVGGAITPVILTKDEAPNIERCLRSLTWANRVVVLDSGSTDSTETIARAFPNVAWFVRPFDSFAGQWEHGMRATGVTSPYVLALDADMEVPPSALSELEDFAARGDWQGGVFGFDYRYEGRRLLGSVYPAQLRLFRRDAVRIAQRGHAHDFSVPGPVRHFEVRLVHDDRKSLERWVSSQVAYSALEAAAVRRGSGRFRDRLRAWGVAAPLMGVVAYLRAGGPLAGRVALRYACERTVFECLLALRLTREADDVGGGEPEPSASPGHSSRR